MSPPALPRRVAVTGATGLVGSAVCDYLTQSGCEVIRMVRDPKLADENHVYWSIEDDTIDIQLLEGIDAVVHLAGRNVAQGRWNSHVKREIRESRRQGTALWGKMLRKMERPPQIFLSASAIGFYGDTGDMLADESTESGYHFLSKVVLDWETEVERFYVPGLRTVQLRFGLILSRRGGALAQMMRLFRFGLGGPVGSGDQHVSWVSLVDAVRAVIHVLSHDSIVGPVNVVAPEVVTNREFATALGRALHRPALLRTPAFLLRLLLGEMADELLLVNAHIISKRLLESGFTFNYPKLEPALRREVAMGKVAKEPIEGWNGNKESKKKSNKNGGA